MARRKGEGGSAGADAGVRAKQPNRPAKKPAKPKVALRGRPPRLAHLVAGSDRNKRRARGTIRGEALGLERAQPGTGMSRPAAGSAGENRGEILCLPNPEWLPHVLTVTGPSEQLTAFRKAASGPGAIPWQRDYARLEEDWVYTLLAPPPAERGISVHGARIVASQMRALIETLEIRAADCAQAANCPLDLNALVRVPDKLLKLGPEEPAVLAWLWENWGTTWMLRDVALASVGRAGVLAPPGHDVVSYRFWSADWTPWRALASVRTRWPALALQIKVLGITE
jgi:hypothetical protein